MLTEAGYEAYIVGGAVRDLLLKLPPGDFDITTSATPEEISAVCRTNNIKTIDNLGQNFGCVVAVIDGVTAEITTFRGEVMALTPTSRKKYGSANRCAKI